MIAAQYTAGAGLQINTVPKPVIQEDELLVAVEATSICGTDVKIVQRGHRKLRPGQTIILGHEFVGTIVEVGRRVQGYAVGTRVGVAPNIGCGHCEMCGRGLMNMCPDYSAFGIDRDGSHTEYVRVPSPAIAQGNVIPLPQSLSPLEATLAEPLSCAVNAMRVSRLQPGDLVLIYGAGPMGLLNLLLASALGAAQVWMVDPDEARLKHALTLGATGVLNPSRGPVRDWVAEQTGRRGMDVVLTAAAVRSIQQEAVELLAPFGRLCLFAGLPAGEAGVELNTNAIHYKNLIVTGMTGGAPQDYRTALKLIESGKVRVGRLISHVFALPEVDRAYAQALSNQGLKIVLAAERWVRSAGPLSEGKIQGRIEKGQNLPSQGVQERVVSR